MKKEDINPVFLELCSICRRSGKLECMFVNEVNDLIRRAKTQDQKDALTGQIREIRERFRWGPHYCRHTDYNFEYSTRRD
jgi:hypothetical protein